VNQTAVAHMYTTTADFDVLLKQMASWEIQGDLVVTLADVSEGKYKSLSVQTEMVWYFTSPNAKLLQASDRLKGGHGEDVYMPLQTDEELTDMRNTLKDSHLMYRITDQTQEERVAKYGKPPRCAYPPHPNPNGPQVGI
jgi:hypothetical protein